MARAALVEKVQETWGVRAATILQVGVALMTDSESLAMAVVVLGGMVRAMVSVAMVVAEGRAQGVLGDQLASDSVVHLMALRLSMALV